MNTKLFFDLDGTLINSKNRLYTLFQKLVPTSQFSFDEYWCLKQNQISHQTILSDHFHFNQDQIELFQSQWLAVIETPSLLALDQVFISTEPTLKRLKVSYELYVVTNRQHPALAKQQLGQLGLAHYFKDIFITEHKTDKETLIRSKVSTNHSDMIIGDTGKDIQTGQHLGIKTTATTTGFLNKQILLKYQPDYIITDLSQLPTLLK